MAEEVEECNVNNILYLDISSNIKSEFKDDSCSVDVCESSISANEIELKHNVWDDGIKEYKIASTANDIKIELPSFEECNIVLNDVEIKNEFSPDETKIEFENKLFFCDYCDEHYEDYCTRCGMLAHILNGITLSITDDRPVKGIPNDILEIREFPGGMGVFALKVIPENVKMGPFNGLNTYEYPWRLKGGKFVVSEGQLELLNWMQYINPAKNTFEQNLMPFQREDSLYYQSNREILAGEELLVYFGEEYEDSVNKDIEMAFVARTEDHVRDVFACTPCCLGFSTREYLAIHKTTCPKETNKRFLIDEFMQCPSCKIYFYEKEYLGSHILYCCSSNVRKCIPLALDNKTVKVNRRKTKRTQMYKCTHCEYKTSYKSILRGHVNKHYAAKVYRCESCSRQFKSKASLKLQVKFSHINIEGKDQKLSMKNYMKATRKARTLKDYRYLQDKTKQCPKCRFQPSSYECLICDYKSNNKRDLDAHIKSKHLKQFRYTCKLCHYKANNKTQLKIHIKSKHLNQFSFECDKCDFKTNQRFSLETHVKSIHFKLFSLECEMCDYRTNQKSNLATHVKTKHLKLFSYECETCDYKTNNGENLQRHVKSKHLKQYSYECEKCDYKTNTKQNLQRHVKSKHLKQFSYECEICNYKINQKSTLEAHVKTKHLKLFSYECKICDYKTNYKRDLENHTKSVHLKQFNYKCEMCDYKSNLKSALETHVKSKHLKQFSYECEICDYKTNYKRDLDYHTESKHLKQFNYRCEICNYRANQKPTLEAHVKSIHLKLFSFECEMCDYRTNKKSNFSTHVKTKHLKQFSYECEICDYKTNNKENLQRHLKSKHLKQFSYDGEECLYKVNEPLQLGIHVETKHFKEFKYECDTKQTTSST